MGSRSLRPEWIVKIHLRSNPRFRSALKLNLIKIRNNSTTGCSMRLNAMLVRYGSAKVAELLHGNCHIFELTIKYMKLLTNINTLWEFLKIQSSLMSPLFTHAVQCLHHHHSHLPRLHHSFLKISCSANSFQYWLFLTHWSDFTDSVWLFHELVVSIGFIFSFFLTLAFFFDVICKTNLATVSFQYCISMSINVHRVSKNIHSYYWL